MFFFLLAPSHVQQKKKKKIKYISKTNFNQFKVVVILSNGLNLHLTLLISASGTPRRRA